MISPGRLKELKDFFSPANQSRGYDIHISGDPASVDFILKAASVIPELLDEIEKLQKKLKLANSTMCSALKDIQEIELQLREE
jgi:hypothetical protein